MPTDLETYAARLRSLEARVREAAPADRARIGSLIAMLDSLVQDLRCSTGRLHRGVEDLERRFPPPSDFQP